MQCELSYCVPSAGCRGRGRREGSEGTEGKGREGKGGEGMEGREDMNLGEGAKSGDRNRSRH